MRYYFLTCSVVLFSTVYAQHNLSVSAVNSSFDERDPVMSPDGATLYFTIANHPDNIGGKKDPGDIWFSRLVEGQWSPPVHGGSLLNNAGYNGVAGMSHDGRQLFLLGHYSSGGLARTQGIAVSRMAGSGWSLPENISIPYFQNKSGALSGCITPDGRMFIYAAETYGSYGVEDLYVTLKGADGKWSPPKNLGQAINTHFQELTPSLSDDGLTLYFSTNGRKGYGSFDIYTATRLDDTWHNWSEPVNMGSQINGDGRDLFYREYPALGLALYTSTTNSDGYGDIKTRPIEERKDYVYDEPKEEVELPLENISGIKVSGKITNVKTGDPIVSSVSIHGPDGTTKLSSDDTGFETILNTTGAYSVTIESQGFVSKIERFDVASLEMSALELNFQLQPIERGLTVNLKNVLFLQSKTDLLEESYPELDLVVAFLRENPAVTIELSGHTDNRGVPADNVKLSQARVQKVKEYLVSNGIDQKRITGKGYGGNKPIANNNDEETRKLNRRVEFTIKRM